MDLYAQGPFPGRKGPVRDPEGRIPDSEFDATRLGTGFEGITGKGAGEKFLQAVKAGWEKFQKAFPNEPLLPKAEFRGPLSPAEAEPLNPLLQALSLHNGSGNNGYSFAAGVVPPNQTLMSRPVEAAPAVAAREPMGPPADLKGPVGGLRGVGGGSGKKTVEGALEKTGTPTNPTEKVEDDPTLKNLKDLITKYEKGDKKLDLSPLVALTDSWTGSRLLQSYDRPMREEEREEIAMNLKDRLIRYEADLKYKKAYLTQMAEDRVARSLDKQEERRSKERIATIGANSRVTVAGTNAAGRGAKQLFGQYKDALQHIAKLRHPNEKNPNDKSFKAYANMVHQEALDYGNYLEETGEEEPGMGYHAAIREFLEKPNGPDAAGAEQ